MSAPWRSCLTAPLPVYETLAWANARMRASRPMARQAQLYKTKTTILPWQACARGLSHAHHKPTHHEASARAGRNRNPREQQQQQQQQQQHIRTMGSVAAAPTAPTAPAGFQIRRAAASDSGALAALGADVFRATFAHSCTEQQLQAFLDEAYTPAAIARDIADSAKDVLLVATTTTTTTSTNDADAGLLGFAYLTRGSREPCVEHLDRPVELQRLYIAQGAHGKGLGKALCLAVDALAREQGFRTIWLGVWEGNHKAQAFYRKMGYEHIGEHVFDVGGDLQTDEIWWKAL